MRFVRFVFGILLIAPVVFSAQGCGGDVTQPVPQGSPLPISQCMFGNDTTLSGVCADMACIACQGRQSCDPFGFARKWHDVAECTQRTQALCELQIAAPHVLAPLASFAACAKDTAELDCDAFLAGNLPASCTLLPGEVADGGACGFDAQCASGVCLKDFVQSVCGVCTSAKAGTVCNGQGVACGPALFCYGGACTPRGKLGDPCTTTLQCPNSVCSQGKCVAPPAEGAECNGYPDNDCDPRHGLACDITKHQCAKIPVNSGSGACGQLTGDVDSVCSAGFTCIVHDSPPGGCEPNPGDGMSCVQPDPTANPPDCQPPAVCSSGTCTLPDPATCP